MIEAADTLLSLEKEVIHPVWPCIWQEEKLEAYTPPFLSVAPVPQDAGFSFIEDDQWLQSDGDLTSHP